jgi:aminoglycoside phosphotransferase (APT) family kinase protein
MAAMIPSPAVFQSWLRTLSGFEDGFVLGITPVDGGASNITCHVALQSAPLPAVALRVQRDRGIFQPYDVIREGEVIRRLAASAVPVPRIIASEPDRSHLGAPFIVMEWVDAPHMGVAPDASFAAYTKAVVAIHALDWRSLGLEFLGVPASPKEALRSELAAIAARMNAFDCASDPLLSRACETLLATIPEDGELALCQGDINVFNYLFRGGEVVAVVDWEQARISDPRSDVGQLVALAHLKGAPFGPVSSQGFVHAYSAASGAALANMEFFRARWLFELGVIYHGWLSFNASEPWYTWPHLASLLEAALAELA